MRGVGVRRARARTSASLRGASSNAGGRSRLNLLSVPPSPRPLRPSPDPSSSRTMSPWRTPTSPSGAESSDRSRNVTPPSLDVSCSGQGSRAGSRAGGGVQHSSRQLRCPPQTVYWALRAAGGCGAGPPQLPAHQARVLGEDHALQRHPQLLIDRRLQPAYAQVVGHLQALQAVPAGRRGRGGRAM